MPPTTLEEALKVISTLEGKVNTLNETVAAKDAIIEQKNQDLVGIRRKYTKLDEMSEEERSKLTEEEIAKKKETDAIMESQETLAKQMADERARVVAENKTKIAQQLAGKDPAIMEKVLKNFDMIKGAENAFTEGEITQFMTTAVNMLGDERPNPVHAAVNGTGGQAPQAPADGQFAASPEGKSLADSMGLGFINQPPAPAAVPPAPGAPVPPAGTV